MWPSMEKTFMANQSILIWNNRNLTRKLVEDYTTTCLLDYEYIKNDRLVAVDLSRQKELDADFKAIQQIWLVGQLKKLDADDNATDAGNDQSMFVLRN